MSSERIPLSGPAASGLFVYTEAALDLMGVPGFADEACLALLVQCVIAAGGTWADVVELEALNEPALGFLNLHHARTVWNVHTNGRPIAPAPQLAPAGPVLESAAA